MSSYNPGMQSIKAYDGTTLENPYSLTSYEQELLEQYLTGKGYRKDSDLRKGEAAYNKYQSYLNWYSTTQNQFLELARNDPKSQVARERAAGLNPDLLGVSSDSASLEPSQPLNISPHESRTVPQQLADILGSAGTLIQAAQGVTSFLSGVSELSLKRQTLNNMKLQGQNLQLSNFGAIGQNVLPVIFDMLPSSAMESEESFSAALRSFDVSRLGLSESDSQIISNLLQNNQSVSALRNYAKNRSEFHQYKGQTEVFSSSDWNSLIKLQVSSSIGELNLQNALNNYTQTVVEGKDPQKEVDAFNNSQDMLSSQALAQKVQFETDFQIFSVFLQRAKYLSSQYKDASEVMRSLIYVQMANMVNPNTNNIWSVGVPIIGTSGLQCVNELFQDWISDTSDNSPVITEPKSPDFISDFISDKNVISGLGVDSSIKDFSETISSQEGFNAITEGMTEKQFKRFLRQSYFIYKGLNRKSFTDNYIKGLPWYQNNE